MAASNERLVAGGHRRGRIVSFVGAFYAEHGYPPTLREIGRGVGLSSSSTVQRHCRELVRSGHLVRLHGGGRGYFPASKEDT